MKFVASFFSIRRGCLISDNLLDQLYSFRIIICFQLFKKLSGLFLTALRINIEIPEILIVTAVHKQLHCSLRFMLGDEPVHNDLVIKHIFEPELLCSVKAKLYCVTYICNRIPFSIPLCIFFKMESPADEIVAPSTMGSVSRSKWIDCFKCKYWCRVALLVYLNLGSLQTHNHIFALHYIFQPHFL